MPFSSFAVLLHCVRDVDGAIEEELAVEALNGRIASLERVEADEAVVLGSVGSGISGYFGQTNDVSKSTECLVQHSFIDGCIEVAHEEVCANIDLLLVAAGLVDTDGLPKQLDTVHDLASILSVCLCLELCESIPLVSSSDPVLWQVHVDDGSCLQHQLPNQGVCAAVVEVAHVASRILVAVLLRWP